jgi:creatinine amidohydrolase/Fe(II)-dependent formamide hydrolase-like protein
MEPVYISEMTPALLRERLLMTPIAYLPLGAIENFGEHLPLGTGGFYAQGLLCALAREVGGVVLTPFFLTPVTSQENGETDSAKSVFAAPEEVFIEMIENILQNLPNLGVRMIAVHGHPLSLAVFEQNREHWQERYHLRILNIAPLPKEEPEGNGTPSAMGVDTCLMMALCPELVELRNLSPDLKDWPPGVEGPDPRSSVYAERGERILDQQIHRIASILRQALQDLDP